MSDDDLTAYLKGVLDRRHFADLDSESLRPDALTRLWKRQPFKPRILILQNVGFSAAKKYQNSMSSKREAAYLWLLLKTDNFEDCTCKEITTRAGSRLGRLSIYQETENGGCPYCQLVLGVVNTYKPGWTSPSLSTIGPQKKGLAESERKNILVELGPQGIAEVFLTSNGWKGHFEFFVQPSTQFSKYFMI
jgi:hypothetical protein